MPSNCNPRDYVQTRAIRSYDDQTLIQALRYIEDSNFTEFMDHMTPVFFDEHFESIFHLRYRIMDKERIDEIDFEMEQNEESIRSIICRLVNNEFEVYLYKIEVEGISRQTLLSHMSDENNEDIK